MDILAIELNSLIFSCGAFLMKKFHIFVEFNTKILILFNIYFDLLLFAFILKQRKNNNFHLILRTKYFYS